jgi:hypothetical protein
VVGATTFFARLVETALREVDRGIIEATQAMGATTRQIITKALLPEAKPRHHCCNYGDSHYAGGLHRHGGCGRGRRPGRPGDPLMATSASRT